MVLSWLQGLWNHPSRTAEDVDTLTSEAALGGDGFYWRRTATTSGKEEAKHKQRGRKQMITARSPDLTNVHNGKCQRCQNHDADDFGPYMRSTVSHHDLGDLRVAARKGCKLCKYLSAEVGGKAEGSSELQLLYGGTMLDFSSHESTSVFRKSTVFEIVLAEGTGLQMSRALRPIAAFPTSKACISLAKSWVANCMNSHSNSGQLTDYAVPLRLIDVSGKTPCLVLGLPSAPYAILSHCWGNASHFTTTTDNVEAHERSIDFAVLPKTFQDAIKLTRMFGVRYLWIDFLCIIQDSDLDKEHQCAMMGDYYRNALITFSALSSRDSTEGFLNARPPVTIPVTLFETLGQATCQIRPEIRSRAEIFKEAVLSGRGWALQERLLSTRVLHFSNTEMFWECLTCTTREGSTIEHRDQQGIRDLFFAAEGEDFKRISFSTDVDFFDADFGAFAVWYRLIRQFSLRTLTFAEDRLPAIAGLATAMADKTGCHYIAGAWTEDLEGLLWHVEYPTVDHGPRLALVPTWSWASVTCSIAYPPRTEVRCDTIMTASVISVNLKVDAASPYGRVEGGSITLLAVCRKVACFVDMRRATIGLDLRHIRLCRLDDHDDSTMSVDVAFDEYSMYTRNGYYLENAQTENGLEIIDVSRLPESTKRFMAVMIAERHGQDPYSSRYAIAYFLIVEEDEARQGHWKRVGVGFSFDWDVDNRVRQEVILV